MQLMVESVTWKQLRYNLQAVPMLPQRIVRQLFITGELVINSSYMYNMIS